MDNEHAVAIVPFSVRLIEKHYDSMIKRLDQSKTELLAAIKSKHACQISSLITPISNGSKDANNSNDLRQVIVRFVIWGPMIYVSAARRELLRSNLSEVIHLINSLNRFARQLKLESHYYLTILVKSEWVSMMG